MFGSKWVNFQVTALVKTRSYDVELGHCAPLPLVILLTDCIFTILSLLGDYLGETNS